MNIPAGLAEALLHSASDAIIATDREGRITFWNPGAERIFAFTAADAVGQSLDIIIPEKLQDRHWAGYDSVMASGETRYGSDCLRVPARHRSGRRLSVEFRVLLLRDRGAVVGIAAFMRDVTAAWEEQQELRRRLAALEAG